LSATYARLFHRFNLYFFSLQFIATLPNTISNPTVKFRTSRRTPFLSSKAQEGGLSLGSVFLRLEKKLFHIMARPDTFGGFSFISVRYYCLSAAYAPTVGYAYVPPRSWVRSEMLGLRKASSVQPNTINTDVGLYSTD